MSDHVNKYLEAAKSHFRALGTPSIAIPEWLVDGRPVTIFWKPLTASEQEDFTQQGARDLDIFVTKSLDAEGRRMFTLEDKPQLKNLVAPQIITRVALRMMQLPSVEQVEKN